MEEDKEKNVIDPIKLIEDLSEQLMQCFRLVGDTEMRRVLEEAEDFLGASPHPEAREADIEESEAISHELGAGRFVHGISKPIEISQDDEPIVWQLDFAATLPWGEEIEGVESEGSWFLIDQRGKVWEYGPMKTPAPLGNEYTRAIPLLKVGDNYMTWAEILSRLAAPKPDGQVTETMRIAELLKQIEQMSAPSDMTPHGMNEALKFIHKWAGEALYGSTKEPAPVTSEEDGPLKSVIHALETADDLGSSVVLDPEEISALRSQLARKDEGLRKALTYLPEHLRHLRAKNDPKALSLTNDLEDIRAALREPDGRKGE